MTAAVFSFPKRGGASADFGGLAVALANVRMACDRCAAIAERIESGEAPKHDMELAEAMAQILWKSERLIDAGISTPTVCRPVCRR